MLCNLTARCTNESTCTVIHKPWHKRRQRSVRSCIECASKIGSLTKDGPLVNRPTMENTFYKIIIDEEICDVRQQKTTFASYP